MVISIFLTMKSSCIVQFQTAEHWLSKLKHTVGDTKKVMFRIVSTQ